jgi:hypothetical protein
MRYYDRMTDNAYRDWIPYAISAAVVVAIASGLLFYNWWFAACSAVAAIGGC